MATLLRNTHITCGALTLLLAFSHLATAQECGDVNGADGVTATDALLVLNEAVGNPVDLVCLTDECGNGAIDPGEDCDQGDLGGATCADQSLFGVGLACGPGCVFDTSGCSATRYEDTGLGTVIDHQTGLEWQKTDDLGGLTDKNNNYTWSSSSPDPDGMAFTDFLYGLNDCESSDGATVTSGGYAGRCDWRMPQIDELLTIVDCSFGDPCIDQSVFGVTTASSGYWSSSTGSGDPGGAWVVGFGSGGTFFDDKDFDFRVRAVRGGS